MNCCHYAECVKCQNLKCGQLRTLNNDKYFGCQIKVSVIGFFQIVGLHLDHVQIISGVFVHMAALAVVMYDHTEDGQNKNDASI